MTPISYGDKPPLYTPFSNPGTSSIKNSYNILELATCLVRYWFRLEVNEFCVRLQYSIWLVNVWYSSGGFSVAVNNRFVFSERSTLIPSLK